MILLFLWHDLWLPRNEFPWCNLETWMSPQSPIGLWQGLFTQWVLLLWITECSFIATTCKLQTFHTLTERERERQKESKMVEYKHSRRDKGEKEEGRGLVRQWVGVSSLPHHLLTSKPSVSLETPPNHATPSATCDSRELTRPAVSVIMATTNNLSPASY